MLDGAPDAVKVACPVLAGGKAGDNIKGLPIGTRGEPGAGNLPLSQLSEIGKGYAILVREEFSCLTNSHEQGHEQLDSGKLNTGGYK